MKRSVGIFVLNQFLLQVSCCFICAASFAQRLSFPYASAGLTERQAAAHLLSRFTYSVTPQQIDALTRLGLEAWFTQQLRAGQPDDELEKLLENFDALAFTNQQVVTLFPKNAIIKRMALEDGIITHASLSILDKKEYREKINSYLQEKGLKSEHELIRQFISQKILRAVYTQNQLEEVMTAFWFNHFNVSFTKGNCSQFIPAYERDVIRPHALGNFEHLLLPTAKSPAMLIYLDNFSSSGRNSEMITANPKKEKGLNENYAREIMELHTLGVDGGYTQEDVTEAARVLTGWTVMPFGNENRMNAIAKTLSSSSMNKRDNFIRDGDFIFIKNRHDDGEKIVLGKKFPAHHSYDEGVALIKLLANHPSTALFISRKIAIRFVNDNPSQALVDAMAKVYTKSHGDIQKVLLAMVSHADFWREDAVREKTKSPFELTISAIRGLNVLVKRPYPLFDWINRMGERLYFYQAPTGFPDRGQFWINTGSLLNRMNFGLALATGKIPGVSFDLLGLNGNHEPASAQDALIIYSKLLLPERAIDETLKRLTPLLNDPDLQHKINHAADKSSEEVNNVVADSLLNDAADEKQNVLKKEQPEKLNQYTLAQVVGIIIGSPEFQRR